MDKKILCVVLCALAALLTLAFAIALRRDALVLYPYGSAPFSLYVAERAVEFLLPAAASLTGAYLLTRKREE